MAAMTRVCTFDLPSNNGTANYTIASDGAGTSAWTDVPTLQNLPTGYINGCKLSFNTTQIVTVGPGVARDSTDAYDFSIVANLSVNIGSTGALGLMTGESKTSSTTYEVHLIGDSSGVNSDSAFLVPAGVTPAESGYDRFRYIGAIRYDSSSDIIDFYMLGTGKLRKVYYWDSFLTMRVLSNGSATTWAVLMGAIDRVSGFAVPGACMVLLTVDFESDVALNANVLLRPEGTSSSHDVFKLQAGEAQGAGAQTHMLIEVPLDTSRDVEYQGTSASLDTDVAVVGYTLEL